MTAHIFYHFEKKKPASGESTIIMIEKVNDSMDMRVALLSEGNISCSLVFVLICRASSEPDEKK